MKNANIAKSLARRSQVESNLIMVIMMTMMMMMKMMTLMIVNMYQVAILGEIFLVEGEVLALSLLLAFAEG